MKRPYIICHILSMLDGKIAGRSFGTPQAQAISEEYARMPRQHLHGQLFFLKVRRVGFHLKKAEPLKEDGIRLLYTVDRSE